MPAPLLFYIDDTSADIELMRTLLSNRGIYVEAEMTGATGLAGYDLNRHTAVAIDWNLPDMAGLDVAKLLLKTYPRCHIAFISGTFEKEHIAAAAALGINQCFEKKMNMEHIARISSFVQHAATHSEKKAM